MSAVIVSYNPSMNTELRDIFFESSSKKDFKDQDEKEAFYQKYLGLYLEKYPELAFVAKDEKVLGYLVASPVTDHDEFYKWQPHLKLFKPYYAEYPAHLHLNCHRNSRGLGIGSKLVLAAEKELKSRHLGGVHIMTTEHARNVSFYKKLGFTFLIELPFGNSPILFMGKSLSEI